MLGRLDFYAPLDAAGSDANLLAASIVAISEGTFSATSNATTLSFRTGASEVATEKMSLTSAGLLTVTGTAKVSTGAAVGGATPGTGGLAFPAIQVAVADVNTLDDYEEGTFTPAITFGGAAVGLTYTTQTGSYTKVGRSVHFQIRIDLSNKGSSVGNAVITALPFSVNAVASAISIGYISAITFADFLMGACDPTATTITLRESTNAGAVTNITDADFANTSIIILAGSYET